MRDKVLAYIREHELLRAGDRVAVAVSGGADSVALLRLLLELRAESGIVLAVAHFNHGLREVSPADEAFVAALAREHDLEFFGGRADVREHAAEGKLSLEAAARALRYGWFGWLAAKKRFDAIATGHTLDDQAETVLLKLLRGAGTRGLAGIYPTIGLGDEGVTPRAPQNISRPFRARIVRPMLGATRDQVERYLTAIGQTWCEDESNMDRRFARNRVRHELLPLLQREYNPNIRQVLSDAAEVARGEEEYWRERVEKECEDRMLPIAETGAGFNLNNFADLPLALRRRVLKRLLDSQQIAADFEHVDKLVRCASGKTWKMELASGWMAARQGEALELRPPTAPAFEYEYSLPVPGEVRVAEIGLTVRSVPVPQALANEAGPPDSLLSADLLGPELTVRNWHPGDRFHPVHRGSEEKLKRLFSEHHIPAIQRPSWPVALEREQIVWVRGFPVARAFVWNGHGDAIRIEMV